MIRNLNQLVELVAILLCLANLYGRKIKVDIVTGIYVLLNLVIFMFMNEGELPTYLFLVVYLGLFFYSWIYYKKDIRVTLVNYFLTVVFMSLLQLIAYLPVYYCWMLPYGITQNHELPINILCLLLIMGIGKKWTLKKISDFVLRKHWLIVSISIFIAICLGSGLYNIKVYMHLMTRDYLQITCFLFLFILVIKEWQKAKIDAERKKTQLEMNQLYSAAYEELITLIRERQHDMKNHINAMYSMIYTIDNYDDLVNSQKEYCQYMLDKNEQTQLLLSSENPLIAGFLYSKIQEAERQGIEVSCKVGIEKSEEQISEYEIIEMIGILFDNAIEAFSNAEEERKQILVEVNNREHKIHISVANSGRIVDTKEIQRFFQPNYSSKGKGRGIGLAKLKKKVSEYAGDIIVSNEKCMDIDFLKFSIIVPMNH